MAPGLSLLRSVFFWRRLIAVRVGRARGLDLRPPLGRALREDEAGDEGEHGLQAVDILLAIITDKQTRLVALAGGHLHAPFVRDVHRVGRPCLDDMMLFTGLMW